MIRQNSINTNGSNINNLRDYLQREENIAFSDFENILRDALDIFQRCLPNQDQGIVKGLIYGYVQSGKTAVIITTMALAADNGYRNFIVLTSDIVDLYEQTLTRIKKSLHFEVLGKKDFNRYSGVGIHSVRVLVSSKNSKILPKLGNLVQNLGWKGEPTIIIDDEADQASLNTNINKPDHSPSKIYTEISNLRDKLRSCTYLQTTATPQALLLQDKGSAFRPDFVVSTSPSSAYVGGNHFFKYFFNDDLDTVDPHIRIVSTINPKVENLPDFVSISVVTFFLGAAILRMDSLNKGSVPKKYTYLLHTSFKQNDHSVMYRLVDEFRNRLVMELTLAADRDSLDGVSPDVRRFLEQSYEDLLSTFGSLPSIQDVIREVVDKIASTEVIEANSTTKDGVKPEPDRQHTLYIGGTKMSRGVTFKNLLITYYGRDSQKPQIDTVLQHARMYGYRQSELNAIRIYLPQHLANRFADIHVSDNAIREQCNVTHEIIPVIPLPNKSLKPTRNNVLNEITVDTRAYVGGQQYFPLLPVSDPDILGNQTEIIDNLLNTYKERDIYSIDTTQLMWILDENFKFADDNSTGAWKDDVIRQVILALKNRPEYEDKASLVIVNRNALLRKNRSRNYRGVGSVLPSKIGNPPFGVPTRYPALFMTRIDGKRHFTAEGINKGWHDHPFWIPVIRFPDGNYAFSINYS
jgi:hypothetical protein